MVILLLVSATAHSLGSVSDGPRRLVEHTLDTCDLDPGATPLEIEVWRSAVYWAVCEYGVSFKVITAIQTMARQLSYCSEEELALLSSDRFQ